MQIPILTTFGLSEAELADALADFKHLFPQIRMDVKAVFPEVHLQLRTTEVTAEHLEKDILPVLSWIRQQLGESAVSVDGHSLETVVGNLLRDARATVAVAESCTGGLISHLMTNVPGSSDYFLMAAVTYANSAKRKLLGVAEDTLRNCGAVHENTAAEMAAGIRQISGADYGLATTGIAGPTGGTEEKPVGTLCVGLAGPGGVESRRFTLSFGDRLKNKKMFAATALDCLRKKLLGKIR